jgi:hypothetical protein
MKRLPRNPSLAYSERRYWIFLAVVVALSTVVVWVVS